MSNASDVKPGDFVWLTHKVFSLGIRKARMRHNCSTQDQKRQAHVAVVGYTTEITAYSDEWWPTWEEAYAHAEELRKKEIARLRRRVEKLESIKFIRKD